MAGVVTPQQVEQRLVALAKETDEAHQQLSNAEVEYATAKSDYEVSFASARIRCRHRYVDKGVKVTVGEVDDLATIDTAEQLKRYYTAEAVVKVARANANRVRTQVDLARSVGSSVRAALDM